MSPVEGSPVGEGRRSVRPEPLFPQSEVGEISAVKLASVLLQHRGFIVGLSGLSFLATLVVALLLPRAYSAGASFMPQSRKAPSSLLGIAEQFGLNVSTEESGQSPAFYAELLKSREILGAAVDARYTFASDTGAVSGSLVEIYRARGKTEPLRRDAAIRRLGRDVAVAVGQRTGTVRLSVTMRYAPLALLVNRRLLELLNQFNLESRQSQAAAERRFTEQRLQEVKQDLTRAEDKQQAFLQRNRDYRNSPELAFEQDRLAREVARQQQLYTGLSQAYEQAKIEEVRDTPVITIVEQPELPVKPDARGLVTRGLLALLLGGMIGVVIAFARAFLRTAAAEGAPEFAEFSRLGKDTIDDLRHPWRPVQRLLRRGE